MQIYFESVEQLPLWYSLLKHLKLFLQRMLRQGADPLGVKKVLVKIINRHALQFEKYNTSNIDLIQELLT